MALFLGTIWVNLVLLIGFFYAAAYLWYRHRFTYWSSRDILGPKPHFIVGNLKDVLTRKTQFFRLYCETYSKYRHLPYFGMFSFHKPVLVVNDLDLAKRILIKDFHHFESHGIFPGGKGDPLAVHLFNIHGEKWKTLRSKMTPSFSSGKLKSMFPLIDAVAKECARYVTEQTSSDKPVNFSELYAKYAIDVIGSIGFGLDCNSFKNPNSEFTLKGAEYFKPKYIYWTIVRTLAFFAPDLFDKLKINRIHPDIYNFYYNLVKNTVEYREKNGVYRNDLLQALIQLRGGQDSDNTGKVNSSEVKLSMTEVAANTMMILLAGYETTATTSNFAAYELALNPEIQKKVRSEVLEVLARHDGVCTYDAQKEMRYLEMVINETMRKHPPLSTVFRKCTKDYNLPDTGLLIKKGTAVLFPLHGYHMNPDIYAEPEKFDPERFSPENMSEFHTCQWMPFGVGPRQCLGLRQAYVQIKLGLVSLISKYELEMHKKTISPLVYNNASMVSAVEGDVWLTVKPLHDASATL